jgi:PAS domain-containing protein
MGRTALIAETRCWSRVDFQRLFDALPGIHLVVTATPDHVMVAANNERCRATMTRREDVIGQRLFDVFPDNPGDPRANGVGNLRASLGRVVATGKADRMPMQRYDIRRPDGIFEERWWQSLNAPVSGPNGEVACILHTVEDATAAVLECRSTEAALAQSAARAREVLEGMG